LIGITEVPERNANKFSNGIGKELMSLLLHRTIDLTAFTSQGVQQPSSAAHGLGDQKVPWTAAASGDGP
jgi:hypothetical protein